MGDQVAYDRVNTLVVVRAIGTRENLRTILHNMGFRDVRYGSTYENIEKGIKDSTLDLLVCEADLSEVKGDPSAKPDAEPQGDPCELVYRMRHHEAGANPFLTVIMVQFKPTKQLASKVIDCGADDFLIMPLSAGEMMKRIGTQVNNRKSFVVTSDYVGPDRRSSKRVEEEGDAPSVAPTHMLEVPNSLKYKATGERLEGALQFQIDEVTTKINQHKLESHAVQMGGLVEILVNHYKGVEATDEKTLGEMIDRMLFLAEDVSRRLKGTEYGHVAELSAQMLDVMGEISEHRDNPPAKPLELIKPLSQAIRGAFKIEDDASGVAKLISESVASGKWKKQPF